MLVLGPNYGMVSQSRQFLMEIYIIEYFHFEMLFFQAVQTKQLD